MYDLLPTRTVGTVAGSGADGRRSEGEFRHTAGVDRADRDETRGPGTAGVER